MWVCVFVCVSACMSAISCARVVSPCVPMLYICLCHLVQAYVHTFAYVSDMGVSMGVGVLMCVRLWTCVCGCTICLCVDRQAGVCVCV